MSDTKKLLIEQHRNTCDAAIDEDKRSNYFDMILTDVVEWTPLPK